MLLPVSLSLPAFVFVRHNMAEFYVNDLSFMMPNCLISIIHPILKESVISSANSCNHIT